MVAPVTLVVGEEEFLVDRAVRELVTAGPRRGSATRTSTTATRADLAQGELDSLTSPSLFGGGSVVVIRSAQNASKDVTAELHQVPEPPGPKTSVLILTHAGGAKGKDLLASARPPRRR